MLARRTALVVLLATLGLSSSADAFEIKHAAGGEMVRWRRAAVEWTVDRSVGLVPGGEDAVVAAVAAWTQRDGAPALAVRVRDAALMPGYDGTNAVFFAPDGFAPAGLALAVTVLTFDDQTGEVLDADIVLNGKYQLGVVDPTAQSPANAAANGSMTYDVGRIVAHEMGHALALSDERGRPDALMYPYVARARALATAPGADDLAGITLLYGGGAAGAATTPTGGDDATATSAGCTGATVAPSRAPVAPRTTFVAAGLVLVALALARRGPARRRYASGCAVVAAVAFALPLPVAADSRGAEWVDAHGVDASAAAVGPSFAASAVVTNVVTTSANGVLRSEVELTTTACVTEACPPTAHAVVWGGAIGRVRQVIGGVAAPVAGDHVGVVLEGVDEAGAGLARSIRKLTY